MYLSLIILFVAYILYIAAGQSKGGGCWRCIQHHHHQGTLSIYTHIILVSLSKEATYIQVIIIAFFLWLNHKTHYGYHYNMKPTYLHTNKMLYAYLYTSTYFFVAFVHTHIILDLFSLRIKRLIKCAEHSNIIKNFKKKKFQNIYYSL